jgi:hypothetical protein
MKPSLRRTLAAVALFGLLGPAGCSSSSGPASGSNGLASGDASAPDAGITGEDFTPTAADFDCLSDSEWTVIGVSKYKNVLGHGAEMLAVANSADGGVYPVGTIIQLVPGEASAKRGEGYNAASHDWEFFTLTPSNDGGTTIDTSGGGASIFNFTGSSCLACHAKAAPQWDFVCGDKDGGNTHGCAPLPVSGAELVQLDPDPRCVAAGGGSAADGGAPPDGGAVTGPGSGVDQ